MNAWHAIGQCATGEWFGVPFIPLLFARMALQWSEIIHLKCIKKKKIVFKIGQSTFFLFLWKLDLAEILELERSNQKLYYEALWL